MVVEVSIVGMMEGTVHDEIHVVLVHHNLITSLFIRTFSTHSLSLLQLGQSQGEHSLHLIISEQSYASCVSNELFTVFSFNSISVLIETNNDHFHAPCTTRKMIG